jgi:hypothetical protein
MPKDQTEETQEIQGYQIFTAPSRLAAQLGQLREVLDWFSTHKVDILVTPGPAGHRIEWNAR